MESTNECTHRRTFWELGIDSFAKYPPRGAKGREKGSKLVQKFVIHIYCKKCKQRIRTVVKWDKPKKK